MAVNVSAPNCHSNLSPILSIKKPPKPAQTNQHPKTQNPFDCLLLYNQILIQGRLPSKSTLIYAMKACALVSALEEGEIMHAHIIKTGYSLDRFVASAVVRFYSACGHLISACKVFDEIDEKDAALQTTMLVGFVQNGSIGHARKLFDEMPERDLIAWNAMLSGYAQSGMPRDVLWLFRELQIAKFRPNEVTLVSALSACSQLGCLTLGEWLHAYINRVDDIRSTLTLNNSLVHMYAKCGRIDDAFRVFVEKQPRNLESWNTMLTSFAIHGHGTSALSLFSQMMKMGLVPDRISFIGMLMACSHGGMVDQARRCFDCMNRMYGIEPMVEHYGCMVDVLSRGGLLDEAHILIENMPFKPDAYVWGALLHGCQTQRNYKLGLQAANYLLELEPGEEGRYIALLNLYAMAGKVKDSMKVRKLMVDMGIKKSSGSSTIEVNGVVHEFVAGDRSHHESKEIYSMIAKIGLT